MESTPSKPVDMAVEIDKISGAGRTYVLLSHVEKFRTDPLLRDLSAAGFFELIMDSHGTPLYFFTNDLTYVKTDAEYELISGGVDGGKVTVEVKITNTGKTVWRGEDNINLAVHAGQGSFAREWRIARVNKNVYPGGEIVLKGTAEVPANLARFITAGLVRDKKYRFRDIGVEEVIISPRAE